MKVAHAKIPGDMGEPVPSRIQHIAWTLDAFCRSDVAPHVVETVDKCVNQLEEIATELDQWQKRHGVTVE